MKGLPEKVWAVAEKINGRWRIDTAIVTDFLGAPDDPAISNEGLYEFPFFRSERAAQREADRRKEEYYATKEAKAIQVFLSVAA